MGKLKDKFAQAYANSKTMSKEEKELNISIQKILLKKSLLGLILILCMPIVGLALDLNIWTVIGFEAIIGIVTFLKIRKDSKKLGEFTFYQGTVLSIENGKKHTTIILKQGKVPVKIELHNNLKSLSNLKKNQFIKLSYNKSEKIGSIIKN